MKISNILKNNTDNKKFNSKKPIWKEFHNYKEKCKENPKNKDLETKKQLKK